jgi:hypothetical protein
MNREDRTKKNEMGAKIYFKMVELYILSEKYNISIQDKIT